MLTLRSSAASPFGRKIKIAAKTLSLYDQITIESANTADPEDTLRKQNPLGKIPVLILENGKTLYDSRVILEYIDHLSGGNKLLLNGAARFDALTLQALADGICDAAILIVMEERMRKPEERSELVTDYQRQKINRALAHLATNPPESLGKATPNVGQIALACALGYLDLRLDGFWRADNPNLVSWLNDFSQKVPAFDETRMPS
ncbi:glutathione S-transferase family protein [Polycladidibacter hongkongensis]|uniref:glutathione S-transferase family protein n=1 Tax=Polycladidibacter hongkongensis TaxID=1647556 RepID=UPI00082AA0E7|nr:glutathione S-transferase family protein [Pseudovibrio hongkongensis]